MLIPRLLLIVSMSSWYGYWQSILGTRMWSPFVDPPLIRWLWSLRFAQHSTSPFLATRTYCFFLSPQLSLGWVLTCSEGSLCRSRHPVPRCELWKSVLLHLSWYQVLKALLQVAVQRDLDTFCVWYHCGVRITTRLRPKSSAVGVLPWVAIQSSLSCSLASGQ